MGMLMGKILGVLFLISIPTFYIYAFYLRLIRKNPDLLNGKYMDRKPINEAKKIIKNQHKMDKHVSFGLEDIFVKALSIVNEMIDFLIMAFMNIGKKIYKLSFIMFLENCIEDIDLRNKMKNARFKGIVIGGFLAGYTLLCFINNFKRFELILFLEATFLSLFILNAFVFCIAAIKIIKIRTPFNTLGFLKFILTMMHFIYSTFIAELIFLAPFYLVGHLFNKLLFYYYTEIFPFGRFLSVSGPKEIILSGKNLILSNTNLYIGIMSIYIIAFIAEYLIYGFIAKEKTRTNKYLFARYFKDEAFDKVTFELRNRNHTANSYFINFTNPNYLEIDEKLDFEVDDSENEDKDEDENEGTVKAFGNLLMKKPQDDDDNHDKDVQNNKATNNENKKHEKQEKKTGFKIKKLGSNKKFDFEVEPGNISTFGRNNRF